MNTAEDIVSDKKREIITIQYDRTVFEACLKMNEYKIGAILVRQGKEFVGVWSERDLLKHILEDDFNIRTVKVGDYMNYPLLTAPHDTPISKLEEMFLGLFVRHLVVEKDGHYIGFISIGDVLRASLLEKDRKFREVNKLVSWDYYEDWGWDRKKKK